MGSNDSQFWNYAFETKLKSDLKTRFALALITVNLGLMTLFAVGLYDKVRERLQISADQALASYLDKEWRHLQLHHGQIFMDGDSHMGSEMYLQILRDGVLVFDSVPKSIKTGSALSPQWKGITRDFHGHINGKRFEVIGYYDLHSNLHYLTELKSAWIKRCFLWLLFLGPFSWLLAKLLLRPFHKLSKDTLNLDAQKLSFRFPDPKPKDEYGILVRSFNMLLGRLESSFHQLRRFSGNVAHELRTPLTVIRGEAEWLLKRKREFSEQEESLEKIVNRTDGLQKIINRLLFLSDLERSQLDHSGTEIPVQKRIVEIVNVLKATSVAQEKQIEISPAEVRFVGPNDLFSSIATNLLENAIKYSKKKVGVAVQNENGGLVLRIEDDGPGIPEGSRSQVFEPFFRMGLSGEMSDPSLESHGLGLSIVKACVDAACGKIELGESKWGGLLVNVWFPQVVA